MSQRHLVSMTLGRLATSVPPTCQQAISPNGRAFGTQAWEIYEGSGTTPNRLAGIQIVKLSSRCQSDQGERGKPKQRQPRETQ